MSTSLPAACLDRALVVSKLARDELAVEVDLLDADHGEVDTSEASVRALVIRGFPDLCSHLASHLRDLPTDDVLTVLDHCFNGSPFNDVRIADLVPALRSHLNEYAKSLCRWEDWHARTLELDESYGPDVAVSRVAAWECCENDAVAADIVGLVDDPEDMLQPVGPFVAFARDARAVVQRLVDEYGEDRVKGVRLYILGADAHPVVRWLVPERD